VEENYPKTIIESLYLIKRRLEKNSRCHFDNMGLTFPQMSLVFLLQQHGPMRITELSNKMDLSNSTISGIVDRLEKENLVQRKRSKSDRRVVTVHLTENLDQLVTELRTEFEEFFTGMFEDVPREDLIDIIKGLKKLCDVLDR
jgi:DNA-binding MarR family transcriptional regulator